jgi:hypothetical protein
MASMMEWGTKHPGLLAMLVGAAACILILTFELLLGRRLDDATASAVFYALLMSGGWYFTSKRFGKTSARLAEHGQVVIFLRYPNSLPGSLSGIWDMGVVTPASGRIEFQPVVYDTLIPTGRSKSLTGLSVLSPPRRAERRDSKQGIPWGFQVMALQSDRGVIEIAASPETLQKIQEAIGSTQP